MFALKHEYSVKIVYIVYIRNIIQYDKSRILTADLGWS